MLNIGPLFCVLGCDIALAAPSCYIREYGSTLFLGMARKKNGRPCISIASDELKSLVIYTHKFLYTHACLYLVFL